jgi:fumarylpyruvate hydrolase
MSATSPSLRGSVGTPAETYSVGNIYCIGRIYAKHAAELGNPVPERPLVFLKSNGCLGPQEGVVRSLQLLERPHHEVELVLWLKSGGRNLSEAEAGRAIGAYGVGLDLTLRKHQEELKNQGHPWTTAKNFENSALVGPLVAVNGEEIQGGLSTFDIELIVNNERRQFSNTAQMLRSPLNLVSYLSGLFPLRAGDLIYTGTPAGVAILNHGDVVIAIVGRARASWRFEFEG